MKKPMTVVLALAAACASAACSSIGTINGVRMNATTAPGATYCERNPTVCVLGGAAIVGGTIAIIESTDDNNRNGGRGGGGGGGGPAT